MTNRRGSRTVLGLLVIGLGVGVGAVSALASDEPTFPTACASGIVADQPPGSEIHADPDSIGVPVVVDTLFSEQLYGESVNLLDGINEQELPVVKEVGSKIKFCLIEDYEDDLSDRWRAFISG